MKLPKREKVKQNITICAVDYTKDIEQYLCYKDTRYNVNNPTMTIKLNKSREYRQAVRDIKAFYRVLKRLDRHGWKPKENEEEAQNERDII